MTFRIFMQQPTRRHQDTVNGLKLKEEAGITDHSIYNAEQLLARRGKPTRIDFKSDTRRGDYFVTLRWPGGSAFRLTGFSWSYGGSGPSAFKRLLDSLGFPEDTINTLPVNCSGNLLVPQEQANTTEITCR